MGRRSGVPARRLVGRRGLSQAVLSRGGSPGLLAGCGKSPPGPFSAKANLKKAKGFRGSQPPHPAADDFIHGLRGVRRWVLGLVPFDPRPGAFPGEGDASCKGVSTPRRRSITRTRRDRFIIRERRWESRADYVFCWNLRVARGWDRVLRALQPDIPGVALMTVPPASVDRSPC